MARHFVLGVAVVVWGMMVPCQIRGGEILERPVRLEADGKVIDTGETAWGHAAPCMEDLDGDGRADLLLGDFSGKFHVYKNVGAAGAPVFQNQGYLQAGGKDAEVRIYCCVAGQPRFLDLDGDGIRDFLSSSYDPGHCYFFRGLPDHQFAAREELLDRTGTPVRKMPQQQQNFQSFGSFFTPVDWQGQGRWDLLIGCFDGSLKLRLNEGDAQNPRFAAENQTVLVGEEPLKVERHCCPVVADWDGDGQWDLVIGSEDGGVTWFRNVGTKGAPRFEKGLVLVEKPADGESNRLRWSEEDVRPGTRVQVEVVDYNGDGKRDLLMGDFNTFFEPKPTLNEAQKKQLQKLVVDLDECGRAYRERQEAFRKQFDQKYPGDAAYSDEATAEWSKSYRALKESPEAKDTEKQRQELAEQIRPLLAKPRGENAAWYQLSTVHGYVWLFLRK